MSWHAPTQHTLIAASTCAVTEAQVTGSHTCCCAMQRDRNQQPDWHPHCLVFWPSAVRPARCLRPPANMSVHAFPTSAPRNNTQEKSYVTHQSKRTTHHWICAPHPLTPHVGAPQHSQACHHSGNNHAMGSAPLPTPCAGSSNRHPTMTSSHSQQRNPEIALRSHKTLPGCLPNAPPPFG
jgi:hypothetical protein